MSPSNESLTDLLTQIALAQHNMQADCRKPAACVRFNGVLLMLKGTFISLEGCRLQEAGCPEYREFLTWGKSILVDLVSGGEVSGESEVG